jgi:hypothetical protein
MAVAPGRALPLTRNLSLRERMSEGQVSVMGTLSQGEMGSSMVSCALLPRWGEAAIPADKREQTARLIT